MSFPPLFPTSHTRTLPPSPGPHCRSWEVQQPPCALSDLVVPVSLKISLLKALFEMDFYCVSKSDVCMESVLKRADVHFWCLWKQTSLKSLFPPTSSCPLASRGDWMVDATETSVCSTFIRTVSKMMVGNRQGTGLMDVSNGNRSTE